jgi:hypothetical protein
MPILGMRTTANFVANQRPENWRESITLLYPSSSRVREAPLTALTSVMKTRKTDDPVFHWWEKSLNNRRFLLTAALGVTATGVAGTLTVDAAYNAATGVKLNDLLFVEGTGEILRVSADPTATNSIPVIRGVQVGGSGLALDPAIAGTNPYVMVIGSAFEEGSQAPTGVNFDPTERFNYTQIFRSTLEGTRTAMRTRLRTGDQVNEAKRECLEYFSVDMEKGFWFGKRGTTTVNGKPWRMMDGVFQQIANVSSANIISLAGADVTAGVDMDWLMARMRDWFRFGSSEKMFFAGGGALLTLGEIVRKNSDLTIQSGIKEYGMEVTKITTPFGQLTGVVHPLFSQMQGGTNGGTAFNSYDTALAILDMDNVRYVYFDDVQYQKDLTPIGLDGVKSGYLAEVSIELSHPISHFLVKNLVKAKKDA